MNLLTPLPKTVVSQCLYGTYCIYLYKYFSHPAHFSRGNCLVHPFLLPLLLSGVWRWLFFLSRSLSPEAELSVTGVAAARKMPAQTGAQNPTGARTHTRRSAQISHGRRRMENAWLWMGCFKAANSQIRSSSKCTLLLCIAGGQCLIRYRVGIDQFSTVAFSQ